uniref:Neuroguidin n=1 Tax=Megaselia scalaris TaxID=36166 RepID=T1GCF7_MEGSC
MSEEISLSEEGRYRALDSDLEIQPDLPQALKLIHEMNDNVKQVTSLVESMLEKVRSGELSTEYGLSFLEVKYHMLLDYLINLTYIVLRKTSGDEIDGDPAIDRLIEIRTVLEKIRPIDQKLRYQIDKLVKTANFGDDDDEEDDDEGSDEDDDEKDDSDEDEDDDVEEDGVEAIKTSKNKGASKNKSGIYVPPKLRPVHYDGDETQAEKEKRVIERAKKRAMTSSMLQDLKEELLDAPLEVSSGSRAQQIFSKQQKEKEEYEEAYLTRLPVTKAEKHRQRKLTTLGNLYFFIC